MKGNRFLRAGLIGKNREYVRGGDFDRNAEGAGEFLQRG